ncbi:MAG: hypothetical protein JSR59_24370 [Proteobacteria bacterium]|nr:hypothetical protein [Pseudomonadota bacterium]
MGFSLWRIDLARRWITANDWGFDLAGVVGPRGDGLPLDELRATIR